MLMCKIAYIKNRDFFLRSPWSLEITKIPLTQFYSSYFPPHPSPSPTPTLHLKSPQQLSSNFTTWHQIINQGWFSPLSSTIFVLKVPHVFFPRVFVHFSILVSKLLSSKIPSMQNLIFELEFLTQYLSTEQFR